ncbi:hypothetical protein MMC19_007791 [Ptychographa xylographoides]|nr:hypothetical protein [Ptychographa xylographoides]
MNECLVDVLNANDTVLHVIPVVVESPEGAARDAECVREALKMAGHLHLVPRDELESLQARVHVTRGGPLTPFGDVLQVRQQAQERAEQRIRTRAYFLWQQEGFPEHKAGEHWYQACDIEVGR